MKRNSKRLSGWIVLAVIALSVGMIGAGEHFPPGGPLAFIYSQIDALFVDADHQQEQIDQLTEAVCGLSVLTDSPTLPLFCAPDQDDDDGPGSSGGCSDPCECGCSGGVCIPCSCDPPETCL